MGLKVGMDLGTLGPYAEPPPDTTLPEWGRPMPSATLTWQGTRAPPQLPSSAS
jgi:hypothetical protein